MLNINMKWPRVFLLALSTGIYTGAVMLIPALKNTSFQDIGISYEWWVLFAVLIVVNCRSAREAAEKCFVFFLVSQPLVYAVEVLFGTLTAELAWMYYSRIWLPMTVLTLPGGWIAYHCKKQNLLGAVILGLGNTIQVVLCVVYAINAAVDFPHHLFSALFCAASAVFFSMTIQKKIKLRAASLALPLVLAALLIAVAKMQGLYLVSNVF